MAEGVVSFLVGKLGLLISQEADFLGGVESQIVSLHEELEWINSFLRDADEKRRSNRRVNLWVSQIRNLAFDAEDIIDLFMLEAVKQHQRNIGLRCMGYPNHLLILHKLGKQMEDINRRIEKISANKFKYGIEAFETEETSSARLDDGLARKARRDRMEEEVDDIGFEKDIEEVTKLLTKEEPPRQLLIVSIVGMGGLGKSTLAKKVYNKMVVKNIFDSCAWIYVSQEYRITDLLSAAISQLMLHQKKELETKDEEELVKMLSSYLKEKRCLIVFDDVWRREDWDKLKMAFLAHQGEGKQQQVLLTTRNEVVARHADSSIYKPRPLGAAESFDLFSKKVFLSQAGSDQQTSYSSEELKRIGEKLVAKCGGLPLAIVVMGGLLSTKEKTPSVWNKVLESANWQLNEGPQKCMDILTLSYTNLPYYLQSCFLYFGLFPEDYEIRSEKLIRLWVAEGFIQERGEESMEDVAEEYLEELIERSMIQVASRRLDGGVETCRIHDLLRDLAISESKKDKLLEIYGSNCSTSLNKFCRLTIHANGTIHPNNATHHSTLQHLRSFLCFNEGLQTESWKSLYVGFNLLRVLDLEGVITLKSLPKEFGGLVLLKYLNLSGTYVEGIPHSMGNLCNMQTLNLSNTKIRHIPKEIWRMHQLRHVNCYYLCGPPSLDKYWVEKVVNKMGLVSYCRPPPRISNLRDLQTLWLNAGRWIEDGLDKLTNLRDLGIRGDLTLHTKALVNSIVALKKLRVLHIMHEITNEASLCLGAFSNHVQLYKMDLDTRLEKKIQDYPPCLIELRLRKSHLKQDDQPMVSLEKLPNLKILELGWMSFEGKEMVCSAGGFAKLQCLELEGLLNLEDLKVEQGAFPFLKVLIIKGCRELKMLPDGLRHITTLEKLNIGDMPKEFNARLQQDIGEDWEKIKHIPFININIWYMED